MNLSELVNFVTDKNKFKTLDDYAKFCSYYLNFIFDGIQAVIVARNVNKYRFIQYKEDGNFNITRPINSELTIPIEQFDSAYKIFKYAISHVRDIHNDFGTRKVINNFVYTCQQSIGAALDALPSGKSNTARKNNGDLFERFIRILIKEIGIAVREGTVKIPVSIRGNIQFFMSYQHDLIVENHGETKAIGSVKTSSKDRLDKIFIDKFLYNKLNDIKIPHFAVFLNDIQRKGEEPNYGVNTTFLAGHYKGYTIKLNPLDGVYYCDMLPIMREDRLLRKTIKTLDFLLVEDIWKF